MSIYKIIHPIENVFLFCFFGLLAFGGLGLSQNLVVSVGIGIGTIFYILLLLSKRILLPPTFLTYLICMILVFVNNLFMSSSPSKGWSALGLFISGGLFFIGFYNLCSKKLLQYLQNSLILIGMLYGFLFIYNFFFDSTHYSYLSLYLPISAVKTHNHLADFWAVVLTLVFHKIASDPRKLFNYVIFLAGIFFLAVGMSRTSYLSLAGGVFYLMNFSNLKKISKKYSIIFLLGCLFLFLFAAIQKSTLFSRPYFVHGIVGVFKYPFGVGMKNYEVLTADPWTNIFRVTSFSTMAHNILVEFLAGLGIFGLAFFYWFFKVFRALKKKSREYLTSAVFLVVTINFMFDFTYFIPTMIWIWFASLGLALRSRKEYE